MQFCKHYPLCAYAVVSRDTALFTRLRCGSWQCEYCAEKNRDIWRAHLADRLPEVSDNWWFITLTAHEHRRTESLSLANIRNNLDRLFKRLRRIFKHVDYVRVYEKHPSSEARHAHLVVCGLSPFVSRRVAHSGSETFSPVETRIHRAGTWTIKTWFKKTARAIGMGYQVSCEPIKNARSTVAYVTKYLTKSFQDLHEKGLRHVQTSRKIGAPKPEGNYAWKVCSYITVRNFQGGTQVIDLQTGTVVDEAYFEEYDYYPPEMM